MVFCKVLKTRAYFSRYQVKYRRRREGKTDYRARRSLVKQDKDKYGAKKYRLIVHISNKYVSAQIAYSTLAGDRIVCSASSSELNKYGITVGLSNYSASYAVGLLIARRMIATLKMENVNGNNNIDGADYNEEGNGEVRPFKCYLDLGIRTPTTGNRAFAIMKGACDGGLNIPHSIKRFPGYKLDRETKKSEYDPSVHRDRIFGVHIAKYMSQLKQNDQDKYKAHFSSFIKAGLQPEDIESMYTNAFKKIRESPERSIKEKKEYINERIGNSIKCGNNVYPRHKRLSKAVRKQRVVEKLNLIAQLRQEAE